MISSLITQKVLEEKIFCYSVLESSQDKLQEYAIKNWGFHLQNLRWPLRDLDNTLQGHTDSAM